MPDPQPGEKRGDFIERCIPVVIEDGTAEDGSQALAVCSSKWDQARNSGGVMPNLLFSSRTNGNARTESMDGRDYLVAPVVLLVEMVLHDELVPADEIARHHEAWNGRPFVLDHPVDADGRTASANRPDTLAETGLGYVFNVAWEEPKLKGELWLDVAKAEAIGGEAVVVAKRLRSGTPLEVSTAYWRDREEVPGVHGGVKYGAVARNLRPDHLAALPSGTGECSWRDGCGAPRANEEGMVDVLWYARVPSYSGTETINWEAAAKTFEAFRNGYYRFSGAKEPLEPPSLIEDAPQAMLDWIASKTLLGNPHAEDEQGLTFFPVVNPATDKLNAGALRAILSGQGSEVKIDEEVKASAQRKARSLLESKFKTNKVVDALRTLAGVFGVDLLSSKQEVEMDELIRRIMDDGRLSLDEDQLKAMSEDTLTALADSLQELPAQGEEPDDPPDGNTDTEPPSGDDPPNTHEEPRGNEMPANLVALSSAIEERGGVDALLAMLDGYETDRTARTTELVGRLVANERCAFTEERLAAMAVEDLETLQLSLRPASYVGQGGGHVTGSQGETIPLVMPDIHGNGGGQDG